MPHVIPIVLYSNNILKIYANQKKQQEIGVNTEEMFSLNLTQEGICDDAHDVILIGAAQEYFNNYKRDNSDLRGEEKPWFYVLTKQGKFVKYDL